MVALDLQSCLTCAEVVKSVREAADKKQHYTENPYDISALKAMKLVRSGYHVEATVDVAPVEVMRDDETVGRVKRTTYFLTERVVWRSGRWQVADWMVHEAS